MDAMNEQPAAKTMADHQRQVAALAEDFLLNSSEPGVRVIQRYVMRNPAPVFVDILRNDQMVLKLDQEYNNLFRNESETLLFTFVPKTQLRNPNQPVNMIASVGADYTHVETTVVNIAATLTADVKHKCAHIFYHRQYKEYHKKLALQVSNVEARCAHELMMLVNGKRYGFGSIVAARSRVDANPSLVHTAMQCFYAPFQAVFTGGYEDINVIDAPTRGDNKTGWDNASAWAGTGSEGSTNVLMDEFGAEHVQYMTTRESLVLDPTLDASGTEVSALHRRTLQEAHAVLQRYELSENIEERSKSERMQFELIALEKALTVKEVDLDHRRGFSQQMLARLDEVERALDREYIVCSQVSALILYVIGRTDNISDALASDAQDVYDTLTRTPSITTTEMPDYEPAINACIFEVSMPRR